jgi:hypothetical protein
VKLTSENKITDLTSDSGNEHLDVVDFREHEIDLTSDSGNEHLDVVDFREQEYRMKLIS